MEFATVDGERNYARVVRNADGLLVGLDFDGTLAPIVEDPEAAHIHPDGPAVLVDLAESVGRVAVVTGRPARQVLDLGGLDEVGALLDGRGRRLDVVGQYGNERWNSVERRVHSAPPPPGLSGMIAALPALLRRYDAEGAYVEKKGLAVGVHTRRLPDPNGTFDRLLPPLTEEAHARDLTVEPGRNIIEIRAAGMDKGIAVRELVDEIAATAVVFVGDDLGDLEAFETVRELRSAGLAGLLVFSDAGHDSPLRPLAHVLVEGPAGVMTFLRTLISDIGASRG